MNKNYKLENPSVQWGFNQSRSKIQVFGGAYANGKTTALVIKSLQLATDYPASNGLLGRSTYPKLNDTLRKVFMEWCPPEWVKRRPTADDNTCILNNGSIINFRYISQRGKHQADGSTTSNLLSATYDWIGVDQVEDPEITHKDILDLMGRLRGDTPYRPPEGKFDDPSMPNTGPRWMMLTSNPTANWFFKEMIHPYLTWKNKGIYLDNLIVDPETKLPIMELHEGDVYSNKANLPADFIRGLEAMYRGQMRERFILGKWAAFEGLVHPDFEANRHTVTREFAEEYLRDCLERHVRVKLLEGYDFGLVSPTCYMLAFVDEFGRVIVLDGFYEPGLNYTLHPARINQIRYKYQEMFPQLKFTDRINADPAIFRKQVVAGHSDTGDTVAKLLDGLGIRTRPATNDIVPGIAKINAYMSGLEKLEHLIRENEDGTPEMHGPLFYVVDDLTFFQDEVVSYYWKKDQQGKAIDTPQDHNDHAMNTLKYLMAFLPEPSKIILPREAYTPQWRYWHEVNDDGSQYRHS